MTAVADPVARLVRVRLDPAGGSRTAGRLGALSVLAVATLAVLFGALAVASAGAREALGVIGHDAGPQVVATTDLYFALSDADGQVADALLIGSGDERARQVALDRFEQRRAEVGAALLLAHRLAGEDAARRETISSILEGFGRYERLAARALLLAEQADYPAGAPPEHALAAYRQATDVMSLELLPQAYNLTLESGTTVREAYDDARTTVLTGRVVVAIGGLLAIGALVWLQLHVAQRFRRRFSPALLVATAVALMYAYTGVTVLGVEAQALQVAKQDGFDAMLSLARARAVSNGLHADQVRYLIDPQRADTYQQVYLDRAQSLVYVEAGNVESYHAGVDELARTDLATTPGLLGPYLDGGGDALLAFQELQQADRELRSLAAAGGVDAAVVGLRQGALADSFASYDAALVSLAASHRAVFDDAIADGEAALADLGFLLPVAMLSIAVLVGAGVAPRLREYR